MNFIKSLFFPTRMNRHRYMSSLIAILIFLIGSFLLTFPSTVRLNKEKYNLIDDFGLDFLSEIPNNEEGQKLFNLKQYNCKVEDGELVCQTDVPQAEPVIVSYQATIPQKKGEDLVVTRNIYFVFDFYDYKNQASTQYNISEQFDTVERGENIHNYLVVFYKQGILTRVQPQLDKKGEVIPTVDPIIPYTLIGFNMSEFKETPNEAGVYLAQRIMDGIIPTFKEYLLMNTLMLVFLMSLIIVTIVWLISRKNGRLKTFKEYYNIASICSIPIFLAFFILYWFIPVIQHANFFMFFNSIFAVYYLFIVFKLNNLPEII